MDVNKYSNLQEVQGPEKRIQIIIQNHLKRPPEEVNPDEDAVDPKNEEVNLEKKPRE